LQLVEQIRTESGEVNTSPFFHVVSGLTPDATIYSFTIDLLFPALDEARYFLFDRPPVTE
jgi:hypothetical protein